MHLWDFCASDFQRALKMIFIAELFIVMMLSPDSLRHNNSENAENAHSRSYVLKDVLRRQKLTTDFFQTF